MFIEDNKPVILVATDKEPLSEFAKFINEKKDFINSKTGFFPRKYRYPDKLIKKDKYRPTRTIQPTGRPVRATQTWYDSKSVAHTIQLKNDLTGSIIRQIPFNGTAVFGSQEWEKVIIFEYLCPNLGVDYEVYDPVDSARKSNTKLSRQRAIANDIYDKISEDDLRVISASYQIMDAETEDIEYIKKVLYDLIMVNFELNPEETESIWKSRKTVDDKTKNRATVQALIDKNIVILKPGQKKNWYVNNAKDDKREYGELLCQVLSKGRPGEFDDLYNYLMQPEKKNDLEFLIGKL